MEQRPEKEELIPELKKSLDGEKVPQTRLGTSGEIVGRKIQRAQTKRQFLI